MKLVPGDIVYLASDSDKTRGVVTEVNVQTAYGLLVKVDFPDHKDEYYPQELVLVPTQAQIVEEGVCQYKHNMIYVYSFRGAVFIIDKGVVPTLIKRIKV